MCSWHNKDDAGFSVAMLQNVERLRGSPKVLAVGSLAPPFDDPTVKPVWPMTALAFMPLLNGGAKTRTLLLEESATLRFPAPSKASPNGEDRVFEAGALPP